MKKKSSTLEYTSQPYAEAMDIHTAVSYTPCDISPKEQIGDMIKFTQLEEFNLLSETHNLLAENCDDTKSCN